MVQNSANLIWCFLSNAFRKARGWRWDRTPMHEINNFLHPGWAHVGPHWAGLLVEFVCAVETTFRQANLSEKKFFCFLGERVNVHFSESDCLVSKSSSLTWIESKFQMGLIGRLSSVEGPHDTRPLPFFPLP